LEHVLRLRRGGSAEQKSDRQGGGTARHATFPPSAYLAVAPALNPGKRAHE
jgi:hypothetical protein